MAYATIDEIQAGFRELTDEETTIATALSDEAAVIIDAYNSEASADAKRVVTCRMVRRAMGDGESTVPIGATQGSISAMGYSQSWTLSSGSTGELYLSKIEKKLLGVGNRIGVHSPLESLCSTE